MIWQNHDHPMGQVLEGPKDLTHSLLASPGFTDELNGLMAFQQTWFFSFDQLELKQVASVFFADLQFSWFKRLNICGILHHKWWPSPCPGSANPLIIESNKITILSKILVGTIPIRRPRRDSPGTSSSPALGAALFPSLLAALGARGRTAAGPAPARASEAKKDRCLKNMPAIKMVNWEWWTELDLPHRDIYIYISIYLYYTGLYCEYIYICIDRERERENGRDRDKKIYSIKIIMPKRF